MILQRYNYSETETEGVLWLGEDDDEGLYTLERAWISGMPGGMPGESCVPDGHYDLLRHARPNGDVVLALRNPSHSVYYSRASVPAEGGRTLILFHSANWARQLQGCIAPGLTRTIHNDERMVGSSRLAMQRIMDYWEEGMTLTIEPALGTD